MIITNYNERITYPFTYVGCERIEGKLHRVGIRCAVCEENYPFLNGKVYFIKYTSFVKGHKPCMCACGGFRQLTKSEKRMYIETRVSVKEKYEIIDVHIEDMVRDCVITLKCTSCDHVFPTKGTQLAGLNFGCEVCRLVELGLRNAQRIDRAQTMCTIKEKYRKTVTDFSDIVPVNPDLLDDGHFYYCNKCSYNGDLPPRGFHMNHGSALSTAQPCLCNRVSMYKNTFFALDRFVKDRIKDSEYLMLQSISVGSELDEATFKLSCAHHGEFVLGYTQLRTRKYICPQCTKYAYRQERQGFLYVVEIEGVDGVVGTGFGITNNVDSRIRYHTSVLRQIDMSISSMAIACGGGHDIKLAENSIKQGVDIASLGVDGFKREFTKMDFHTALQNMVNLTKEFDLDWKGVYTGVAVSNEAKRRALLREILKGEK